MLRLACATSAMNVRTSVRSAWQLQRIGKSWNGRLAGTPVSGAAAPSVIRLHKQGLNAMAVVGVVRNVLADFQADLEHGALVTFKARKVTCHRLPIGRD